MKALNAYSVRFAVVALFAQALVGCQSPQHRMVDQPAGTKIACQQCYDELKRVTLGASGAQNPGVYKRHACEGCKTEMSVYTENGVLKIRCAKCAPEGVACDKCLSPDKPNK